MTTLSTAPPAPSPALPSAVPPVKSQELRRARLRTMKRRATLLLGAVTIVWLLTTIFGGGATWAGYVQAAAEAAMVGALADWFAVTALFRHPLHVPIPHTAIIVERKDQFAATLGDFIQDTFLTPDAVIARLRAADVVPRLSAWLTDPTNAARLSADVMDGAVTVADLLRDDEVSRMIEDAARQRLDAVPLAPLAGRGLQVLLRDGRHQQVFDVALREIDSYLDAHRAEFREQLGRESPWWLPGAAEDRIFERLIDGARSLIGQMLDDPEHRLRQGLEQRLHQLAHDLQTDESFRERGEHLKHEVLDSPEVRAWAGSLWQDAKAALRAQADDPDSELRRRLGDLVVAAGTRLADDPVLAAKVEDGLESAVTYVVDRFHGEISELVSTTIARWDGEETADRLELLLGPDLQFIRINGTVVGALAGLVLYSLAQLIH
jgi:uncharacterized membrane-anchored protein YjiN (DUF445 family)